MNGRKRHILVDTEGVLLRVAVLAGQWPDRDGLDDVCRLAAPVCPRLELVWAASAYAGEEYWLKQTYGWQLAVVRTAPDQQGFVVQPRRWVVDRTFGWLGRNRRLSKDDEEWADVSESWVYLAMTRLMLRRRTA